MFYRGCQWFLCKKVIRRAKTFRKKKENYRDFSISAHNEPWVLISYDVLIFLYVSSIYMHVNAVLNTIHITLFFVKIMVCVLKLNITVSVKLDKIF